MLWPPNVRVCYGLLISLLCPLFSLLGLLLNEQNMALLKEKFGIIKGNWIRRMIFATLAFFFVLYSSISRYLMGISSLVKAHHMTYSSLSFFPFFFPSCTWLILVPSSQSSSQLAWQCWNSETLGPPSLPVLSPFSPLFQLPLQLLMVSLPGWLSSIFLAP